MDYVSLSMSKYLSYKIKNTPFREERKSSHPLSNGTTFKFNLNTSQKTKTLNEKI